MSSNDADAIDITYLDGPSDPKNCQIKEREFYQTYVCYIYDSFL